MGLLGSGSAHMAGRAGRALPNTTQDKQNVRCQRCLQMGHYTFECKNEPAYQSRPSRTQQLKNPKLYKQRFLDASELPEELRPKPPPVAAPPKPSKEERKKKKKKKQESSSEDSSSDEEDEYAAEREQARKLLLSSRYPLEREGLQGMHDDLMQLATFALAARPPSLHSGSAQHGSS
mmetsp:Transcript_8985/g.24199  ORF Transcript_8985/g.24199 Transcript_8985/m.24199 type:complete len:177 (+) Transcript_8985:111-641(+)